METSLRSARRCAGTLGHGCGAVHDLRQRADRQSIHKSTKRAEQSELCSFCCRNYRGILRWRGIPYRGCYGTYCRGARRRRGQRHVARKDCIPDEIQARSSGKRRDPSQRWRLICTCGHDDSREFLHDIAYACIARSIGLSCISWYFRCSDRRCGNLRSHITDMLSFPYAASDLKLSSVASAL